MIDNFFVFFYNISMRKKWIKVLEIVIVNIITSIRLIGALMLPFIYHKYSLSFTSLFIIILFSSDAIDGFLARKLHVSTFFGSAMDAFSDKLLNTISFIILGLEYNILIAPLAIEVAILYTIYSTYRYGGNIQSSKAGKIKTVIVDVCILLCFVLLALPTLKSSLRIITFLIGSTDIIIFVLALVILISCLIALIDYMGKNKEARLNPKCMNIKYEEKNRKPVKLMISNLFDTEYYAKHKDESIIKQLYIK